MSEINRLPQWCKDVLKELADGGDAGWPYLWERAALERMEQMGLVEQRHDKYPSHFTITPAGRACLDAMTAEQRERSGT